MTFAEAKTLVAKKNKLGNTLVTGHKASYIEEKRQENHLIIITIPFDKCNLKKATIGGLNFMLEILVNDEQYERAAIVRDEINSRN